jgi:hypothetical protein
VFFSLGLVIIINPKKDRVFKLYKYIWLIAIFGILHGINEWLDMFIDLNEPFFASQAGDKVNGLNLAIAKKIV